MGGLEILLKLCVSAIVHPSFFYVSTKAGLVSKKYATVKLVEKTTLIDGMVV